MLVFYAKCDCQVITIVSEKYFINGSIPSTYCPIQSNFHRKLHTAPYSSGVWVLSATLPPSPYTKHKKWSFRWQFASASRESLCVQIDQVFRRFRKIAKSEY